MKHLLVIILLAASPLAQDEPVPAACASKNDNYDVKLDETRHTLLPPEPGKARVYFIQDLGFANCLGVCLTTKVGLDGKWVGANRHSSYFSVSVEAGEHHLCVNPQSHFAAATRYVALAHFNAEAGRVYYFRTRMLGDQDYRALDFVSVDSDQGEYLITTYPLSVSRLKK